MISPQNSEVLPFKGGGDCPVQWEVKYEGDEYYVRYRSSWLTIDKNDVEVFEQQLAHDSALDGYWSGIDTSVYLPLISQAIREGALDRLRLPTIYQIHRRGLAPVDGLEGFYIPKRHHQWSRLKPIYPSWMIGLAAMIGGPLGAGYFLHENFLVFDKKQLADKYSWGYIVAVLLLCVAIFSLPEGVLVAFLWPLLPFFFGVTGVLACLGIQGRDIASYKSFGGQNGKITKVIGLSIIFGAVTVMLGGISFLFRDLAR